MKNLLSLLVFTFITTSIFSQGLIEEKYEHYLDQEEVTHVYISGKLFDFASTIAAGIDDDEVKELSEFASKIKSFSLIKVPNSANAKAEYAKGIDYVGEDYDELMRVRDDGSKFAIFVDEEDDVVYEVVGIGISDGEFIALSLVGEMDLNKIAEFVSKADSDMFEPLKRMEEFRPDELKVYPNPSSPGAEMTIEVPDGMIGGNATLIDANGNKIKSITINNSKEKLDTNGLTAGNYFVEFNNDSITMKKQIIIIQ